MKYFGLNSIFVISIGLFMIITDTTCDNNKSNTFAFNFRKYRRVLDAIRIILYGENENDDLDNNAKDMFLDTKKGVLNAIDRIPVEMTLDEMLRIFIQSLIIVTTQKRYDLLPEDFGGI